MKPVATIRQKDRIDKGIVLILLTKAVLITGAGGSTGSELVRQDRFSN
jgi:FlaA1/EpsC-like NDP-sugar epimerase